MMERSKITQQELHWREGKSTQYVLHVAEMLGWAVKVALSI